MYPNIAYNNTMTINPIRYARATEHKSQQQVAKELGVSRPFIIRSEQGCYNEPSKSIADYAARVLNTSRKDIKERYEAYQLYHRQETVDLKPDITALKPDSSHALIEKHVIWNHEVFKTWREAHWNSVTSFCIDLCIHPYSVAAYEDGKMYSMPDQVELALRQTGLIDNDFKVKERWYYAE
jgi:transcriptional regulator with XRE-family HTH domain